MCFVENPVLNEDLEYLRGLPLLRELAGKCVLVTGATGLIGQTLVTMYLHAAEDIHVIACVRDKDKAVKMFGPERDGRFSILVSDILELPARGIGQNVDYMIHAASQTSSRAFVDTPVETLFTAVDGTRRALEFARANQVRCFVYLSTMEVYGTPGTDERIDEKHGTNLDTTQVRSCYPESKRLCETLCVSYQKEYGVPVRILRLTQTFGPGVSYGDGRVFAEFARCALEGRDIILKTAGATCRSYLYTADAAAAILAVMIRGADGEAYNAANEETYCSILEMAEMTARDCAQNAIRVRIEAQQDPAALGYAPTLHMNLDTAKLRALGWQPSFDLPESYRRMMRSMEFDRSR